MEGYIIETDEGVVALIEGKFIPTAALDYSIHFDVAIFMDEKEAKRVARNVKRRKSVDILWAEILPVTLIE